MNFKKALSVSVILSFLAAGNLFASAPKGNSDVSLSSIFRFGIKGGADFMTLGKFEKTENLNSVRTRAGFVAGAVFSFDLPVRGMTIQPELNYISKGARFSGERSFDLRSDYIELPVNIQAGLDLILLRPFLMVSPYIGYAVFRKNDLDISREQLNRFEYGIGAGAGMDFWRFQLQVKYNWNLSSLIGGTGDEVPDNLRKGNLRGLDVSLVLFF